MWDVNLGAQRIGMTNIANNGQKMTIIAYRNKDDIDVQFENGFISYHKNFNSFKKGGIGSDIKNSKGSKYVVGLSKIMNNGQKAEIIKFISPKNIEIKYEDGTIVKTTTSSFRQGSTINPNYVKPKKNYYSPKGDTIKRLIGLKNTNKWGETSECIDIVGYGKIKVKYENGIEKIVSTSEWKKGTIPSKIHTKLKDRIGETRINKNRQTIELIDVKDVNDLTIKVKETGKVYEHCSYSSFFAKGRELSPKDSLIEIGKEYASADGTVKCVPIKKSGPSYLCDFGNGLKKLVSSDKLNKGKFSLLTKSVVDKYGFKININSLIKSKTNEYFKCQCKKCSFTGILTPQQMMAHTC